MVKKTYHTVETVVEIGNLCSPDTQIHYRSLSWLTTCTSIKCDVLK